MQRCLLLLTINLLVIILLIPVVCFAEADTTLPLYFSFESDTADTAYDDGDGGGMDTNHTAQCQVYIRDDYTAREGNNYIAFECPWPGSCSGISSSGPYERASGQLEGAIHDNPPSTARMAVDTGKEYRWCFSVYIPSVVEEPYFADNARWGQFQIFGGGTPSGACIGKGGSVIGISLGGTGSGTVDNIRLAHRYPENNGDNDWNELDTDWTTHRGTWIDFCGEAIWYSADNANAKLKVYINGTEVYDRGDGEDNICPGIYPYFDHHVYNTGWSWSDEAGCASDMLYENETFTRHVMTDAIRVLDSVTNPSLSYAHVSPAIPPATPNITSPTDYETNIPHNADLSVTATAYADHADYSDGQGVFSHHCTHWRFCSTIDCSAGGDPIQEYTCTADTNLTTWTVLDANIDASEQYFIVATYYSEGGDDLDRNGDGTTAHSDSNDIYASVTEISRFNTAPLTEVTPGIIVSEADLGVDGSSNHYGITVSEADLGVDGVGTPPYDHYGIHGTE
jgi:hypothetical protein